VDLAETGYGSVCWSEVTVHWRAVMNTIMDYQVPVILEI
jgi:hypothetical protein